MLSCYQAFLPDVNENQFNQQGIRYIIHFISNSIFSLTGKCLLVKNFANAWRSNLSEQILRCWMKPSSQWSTKWSCLSNRGEERRLWGGICFRKQGIKATPQNLCHFLFSLWKGESSGFCCAFLYLLTSSGSAETQITTFGSPCSPGHSITTWWDLSRPASLSPCMYWYCFSHRRCSGMEAMLNINVHVHFTQPVSAMVKGGGSGKKPT